MTRTGRFAALAEQYRHWVVIHDCFENGQRSVAARLRHVNQPDPDQLQRIAERKAVTIDEAIADRGYLELFMKDSEFLVNRQFIGCYDFS